MNRRAKILVALLCWVVMAEPGRVIDGDTFEAKIAVWLNTYTIERVRVLGVDTPEITGATRDAGLVAKHVSAEWLARGDVTLTVCKRDSFGRLLSTVTRGEEDLAELLIQSGHGVRR